MRAFIVAILLLVGTLFPASADVPIPQRKPVPSECPAGMTGIKDVWVFVENLMRREDSGNFAALMSDKNARRLTWALSHAIDKEIPAVSELLVFVFPDTSQAWVMLVDGCAYPLLVIDADTVKAIEGVLKSTI